ncbi:MAG TPA: DUF2075 domain-containing protein [Candidatus Bathyarchaeia archaeon]|nr:DUF2075 domain-containing protein [Candidatus Bathyarchaeia archaeon]
MKLYSGTTHEFVRDILENKLTDELRRAYEDYFYRVANPSEVASWTNSLQFVKNLVELASLNDNQIIVEYIPPYSSMRIDCMLFGRGSNQADNVVLIELKQWTKVTESEIQDNVVTFVGGADRSEAHPSFQAKGYDGYLRDYLRVFEDNPPLNLTSVAYCHNYSKTSDVLFGPNFQDILERYPLFAKEDVTKLAELLKFKLASGHGLEVFNRFTNSSVGPSKKLLEHARRMIEGQNAFHLVEDQITAYNTIIDRAKKSARLGKKTVIVVQGGPGTGKSLIALNAVAELGSKGIKVFHATGSAAFTSTLRKILGQRAGTLFKYFNSFSNTGENEIDVLVCDEAHRIRRTSNDRYTKRDERSEKPQVDELIGSAKLSVFFIDNYQVVRPFEIGSTQLIKDTARKFGADFYEFELKTQFRCSGSDGYLNWLDNTLGVRETPNKMLTPSEKMDFRIFDNPLSLYEAIRAKNDEKPNSARMVAGFCWPWSDPNPDGTLKEDVVIGEFRMTWEAKNEASRVAPGIPRAKFWAFDPNGVDQMGSIYTIQGFEFDYVGVVFGKDLLFDSARRIWVGEPKNSADGSVKRDKENFLLYVRNAYRVLMTRGMLGCYVCFMDKNTEDYFRSRIDQGLLHRGPSALQK